MEDMYLWPLEVAVGFAVTTPTLVLAASTGAARFIGVAVAAVVVVVGAVILVLFASAHAPARLPPWPRRDEPEMRHCAGLEVPDLADLGEAELRQLYDMLVTRHAAQRLHMTPDQVDEEIARRNANPQTEQHDVKVFPLS